MICNKKKCWNLTKKRFCRFHRCLSNKCENTRANAFSYCHFHICMANKCSNPSISGQSFCRQHKCAAFDCGNVALNHDYCDSHMLM